MDPSLNSGSLFASLGLMLAITAILYVYVASMLMIIARKTATPDGWMAWIPIANLVLMCRIARASMIWVLLAIIPLINLVALVVLFMGIARRCGKPSWIGVLFLIPGINLLIPAYLAFGTPSTAISQPTMAAVAGAGVAQSPARSATPAVPSCGHLECAGETFCAFTGQRIAPEAPAVGASRAAQPAPSCGHADCAGETFCAYTGQRIAPSAQAAAAPVLTPPAAAKPTKSSSTTVVAAVLIVMVGLLIAGAIFIGPKLLSRTAAQRQPQMTQPMAGTLSEFPVPTAANPARPTAITSQNFNGNETAAQVRVPPKSLPPGIAPATLPKIATSMTSATYQAQPQDPPVNVCVWNTRRGSQPSAEEALKQIEIAAGPQAAVSGIKVQNPAGSEYTGYRVRTAESETYVLAKLGANILVTIFSSNPSVRNVASQLAANLGNGAGLLQDPGMRGGIFSLPASPPPGYELDNMTVQDSATLEQLRASLGNVGGDGQQFAKQLAQFVPQRITSSTYKGPNSEKLEVVLGQYGGTASAWTTWSMLRMALRGVSNNKDARLDSNVTLHGGSGIGISSRDKKAVLFQRGPYLVVVHSAANVPENHLISLADSLQF